MGREQGTEQQQQRAGKLQDEPEKNAIQRDQGVDNFGGHRAFWRGARRGNGFRRGSNGSSRSRLSRDCLLVRRPFLERAHPLSRSRLRGHARLRRDSCLLGGGCLRGVSCRLGASRLCRGGSGQSSGSYVIIPFRFSIPQIFKQHPGDMLREVPHGDGRERLGLFEHAQHSQAAANPGEGEPDNAQPVREVHGFTKTTETISTSLFIL